jgi:inhibitor of KinA
MDVVLAGDEALMLRFGEAIAPEIDPRIMARVTAALEALEADRPGWVVDLVPAYATLLVRYDGARATAAEARAWVEAHAPLPDGSVVAPRAPAEIPVWYDPSVAPDLEELAAAKGLAPEALAALHAAGDYRVYALGFRPGFPFLGVVDERLAAPRLPAPRPRVAAGSVGIAGRQTGIYPVDGPGGWRIVGRTPLRLFDPGRGDPFLLRAGDRVRFVPVDGARYAALGGR